MKGTVIKREKMPQNGVKCRLSQFLILLILYLLVFTDSNHGEKSQKHWKQTFFTRTHYY